MSPSIEIRPATMADARTLVLRRADREEIDALTGGDPQEALAESVARSASAWAGVADGALVCLFGVVPAPSEAEGPASPAGVAGIPWLLGADSVAAYGRPFLRRNRAYVRAMLRDFPVLANVVDARNAVSIRWLRWLGFTLGPPQPMGVKCLPFIPFEMRAPC
jgi:hypothetical protein